MWKNVAVKNQEQGTVLEREADALDLFKIDGNII